MTAKEALREIRKSADHGAWDREIDAIEAELADYDKRYDAKVLPLIRSLKMISDIRQKDAERERLEPFVKAALTYCVGASRGDYDETDESRMIAAYRAMRDAVKEKP